MADPTLDELIEWHVEQKGNRWGYTYKEWDAALAAHLRRLRALDAAVLRVREMHAPNEAPVGSFRGTPENAYVIGYGTAIYHALRALDARGGT